MARPKSSGKLLPSNPECINSGALGLGCFALEEVDPRCGFGSCPFFKTRAEQTAIEMICAIRCAKHGIKYQTREEVIREYDKNADRYIKRRDEKA